MKHSIDPKIQELYENDSKLDQFSGVDFMDLDDLLTEEQKLVRNTTRNFVKKRISPIINWCAQENYFPYHLVRELGNIGAFGPQLPLEFGAGGLDYISYGLMMQEIERGDSGIRSTASVQGSLVMYPISKFGSEEQKQKYITKLAKGEFLGSFGLTEPDHGSNPAGMITNFTSEGDFIKLNGAKTWISNSPYCDVAVVWAKDENGIVHGVLVDRDTKGFSTPNITNKWSLRASTTGELVFEDCLIPKTQILPNIKGMKGPLTCLNSARYGICWGVIGAAMDCYEIARKYALERKQFDKPIASFQLQQKKLAEMLTQITQAQLLAWRVGSLMDQNKATPAQISMAKRNNVEMALNVARESRQILGGMGISGDYPIMRHMMNLESVITYEGTHDIHLLILGMEITGINAFI